MRLPHIKLIAILGAASLLAVLGCGNLPTDPAPASTSGTQHGVASLPMVLIPVPDGDGSAPKASTSVSNTVTIDGSKGGIVTAGRFSVIVPPLAIRGTATITVTVPDSTRLLCDLSISPPSANKFLIPVTLHTECGGLAGLNLSQLVTYWYDPALGLWVPQVTVVDLLSASVNTPLSHFSRYAVSDTNPGKSGW